MFIMFLDALLLCELGPLDWLRLDLWVSHEFP
jgi:hypothetical protein